MQRCAACGVVRFPPGAICRSCAVSSVAARSIFTRGPLGYDNWAGIFHPQWMKMLTFATIVGLLYHVWVGMRDVLMDYVKPVGIRLVLQILVIVWLLGCAGWAIQVLWRV